MSRIRIADALIVSFALLLAESVVAMDNSPPGSKVEGGESVIPGALSLAGAYETQWESDVRFFNPCWHDVDVHIEFQPENTDNVGQTLTSRDLNLAARSTVLFGDIHELLPDLGGGEVTGSLLIQSSSASGCSALLVSRTFNDTPEGTLGLTVPAMRMEAPEEQLLEFPGLIHTDDYRTNLRLVNFSNSTAWVRVTAIDGNGSQVGSERSAKVFGRSTKQINGIAEWLGVSSDLAPFVARVEANGRQIQAVATVVDNITGDSVLYTSSSADVGLLWLAGAASLSGVNESQWRTDLWLYNPTGDELAGDSEFFVGGDPDDSYLFGWPTLDPYSTYSYLDLVSIELGLEETRGYVILTGDGGAVPQVAARTYNLDPVAGTYGLNLRPYRSEDLLYPSEVGFVVGISNSTDLEAGFRTNLGLLNTDPSTRATVRLTMYTSDGSKAVDEFEVNIAAGKLRQFNVFDKLGLGDQDMVGSLRIDVISGAPVAIYATEIDNRTQDSIFITAQRADFGTDCRAILEPAYVAFDAEGGNGSFNITTTSECTWEVLSQASWLTVTGPSSGMGNGTVDYTVDPNHGAAREGRIRGPRTFFRVSQDEVSNEITVSLPGDVPMDLVYIPPGDFDMGSPSNERGRRSWEDLHPVTLTKGYFIGKYEVTQEQWVALMGSNPSVSNGVGDDYPVFWVTWNEVAGPDGFIDRLNDHLQSTGQSGAGLFRLPTEAEWEMAARADTQTRFSFGDALDCSDTACESCEIFDQNMWWCGNTDDAAMPVGTKPANAFGLHDMHGNVHEWVQDGWKENLGAEPQTDPLEEGEDERKVTRGGSYFGQPRFDRSASRHAGYPTSGGRTTGFRVARSAVPPAKILSCGRTVTTDAVLETDLVCETEEYGIRVGASNVTLDLGGHTISGHYEGFGVAVWDVDAVTVENGSVDGWGIGVDVIGSRNVTLQDLTIRDLQSDDPDEFLTGVTTLNCRGFVVRDTVIEFIPVYHKEGVLLYDTEFTIDDIEFRGGAVGVNVSSSSGTVKNSHFSGATGSGVLVGATDDTRVVANEFVSNEVAVDAYSLLEEPGEVTGLIVDGNLIDPAFQGVHLWGTSDSIVRNNIVRNCWRGIVLDKNLLCPDTPNQDCYFATGNLISGNEVTDNSVDLYHHPNATGNTWEENTCETWEGEEIPPCSG